LIAFVFYHKSFSKSLKCIKQEMTEIVIKMLKKT
jgi:hypothetical protein